jgi:cyclophilin family peptidyl-prolyl cis-trans isomerase
VWLRRVLIASVIAMGIVPSLAQPGPGTLPRVLAQTDLGSIVIELDPVHAPITTANFLKYVDAGHYNGGTWHRTVTMNNQPESDVKIEVIQAAVNSEFAKAASPQFRSSAPA